LYLCWVFFLYLFYLFFFLLLPFNLCLSLICPHYPGQQLINIKSAFMPKTLLNVIIKWVLLHLFRWWLGFFDVLRVILLPNVDLPLFIENMMAFMFLSVVFGLGLRVGISLIQ
jgi:hypothetical protein